MEQAPSAVNWRERNAPKRPGQMRAWSYQAIARRILAEAESALDMGTGEGGVLASLAPLPRLTVAYEEWWPTVPAAMATLRPLGVQLVVALGSTDNVADPSEQARPALPFRAQAFDVVLNRHEAFDPYEVHRITKPHGRFLTEQVGSYEAESVRTLLGLPVGDRAWTAAVAMRQLEVARWAVEDVREEHLTMRFSDIAALIGYVRSSPWAFTDLDWRAPSRGFDSSTHDPSRSPSKASPTASCCWPPAEPNRAFRSWSLTDGQRR